MTELVIEWTPELRARVAPRSAKELPEEKPKTAQVLWTATRKRFSDHARIAFEKGLEHAPQEERERTRAALAIMADKAPPSVDTPAEVLAPIWRFTNPWGVKVVTQVLIQQHGLETAVRSWVLAASIKGVSAVPNNHSAGSCFTETNPPIVVAEGYFREALLRASPDDYARAVEAVAPLFERADPRAQIEIVRRFPNEKAWTAALAKTYLEDTTNRLWGVQEVLEQALDDLELTKKVLEKAGPDTGDFETLLATFGADIMPTFLALGDRAQQASGYERLARIFSIVHAPEVAAFYAKNLGKKAVRRYAVDYFPRFPALRPALEPYMKGKSRVATIASELFEQCKRAEETQAAPREEVPLAELPAVLVSPPWAGGEKHKRKAIVIADAPLLDGPTGLHFDHVPNTQGANNPELDAAGVAAWLEKVKSVDPKKKWPRKVQLFDDREQAHARVPRDVRLRVWNEGLWPYDESSHIIGYLLAESGLDALPGVVRWAESTVPRTAHEWGLRPLLTLEAPALAPAFAHALRRHGARDHARSWMRRYTEAAIAGLLPAAVGAKGKRRTVAEQALRWLASEGHEARIRERAKELGKKGPAAIEEILSWDPLYDCPTKPPNLASSRYRPELYARPTTKDGRALPLEAVRRLGEMLAFSPPDETYAGIQLVKDLCDERSLAEHAWQLASAWEHGGAAKRDRWMFFSLVHLADDIVVRRTTPALKSGLVVDVLTYIGTEAAAMELATIAARGAKSDSPYNNVRRTAEAALNRLAEAQGIARAELDDRLTPTCGLDERGTMVLDFGSRSFRVGFDEHLEPEIIDDEGNRRKAMARGAKNDDPEKVERAKLLWAELQEDVGAIAMMRIEAIERAMVVDRAWSVADFETYWARHPLMQHLARRIVWSGRGPARDTFTFRVTEDGTFADADDEPVTLDGVETVLVPHPLRWPDGTLETWRELFADYELIQPYPQLGRPAPRVTEEELQAATVRRQKSVVDQWNEQRRLETYGYSTIGSYQEKSVGEDEKVRVQVRAQWDKGKYSHTTFELTRFVADAPQPWSGRRDLLSSVLDEAALFE